MIIRKDKMKKLNEISFWMVDPGKDIKDNIYDFVRDALENMILILKNAHNAKVKQLHEKNEWKS